MNDTLQIFPSFISGEFSVPGSKSHTIRALIAGCAAEGISEIINPLTSDDTVSTANAITQLGAAVDRRDSRRWTVTGCGGRFTPPENVIDMGNSGTGLRLLAALAAHCKENISFDGDSSLRTRKMQPLFDALMQLGCTITSADGKAPFSLCGPLHGGQTKVKGTSSQYISALLFACPLTDTSVTELEVSDLCEIPYIYITLNWLERLGVSVKYSDDLSRISIPGRQKFKNFSFVMPGDFSTAAFPLAGGLLAAAPEKEIVLKNLDFSDAQGDKAVFDMLKSAGGDIEIRNGDVIVRNSLKKMKAGVFDLNATPDALPMMAAFFAALPEKTMLVNAAQARFKECDRITVMAEELRKMGAVVEEFADGMSVCAPPEGLHGADDLASHGDHRIAMSLACAALAASSPSSINGIKDAAVTYPDFVKDFQASGAKFILQ